MINETINYYLAPYINNGYLFGFLPSKYAVAITILLIFFIISKLVLILFQKVFVRVSKKTKNKLDDLLVDQTNRPISLLLFFFGIKVAVDYLNFQNPLAYVISKGVVTLIYVGIIYLALVIVRVLVDFGLASFAKKTKSSMDDALLPLLSKTANVIVIVLGIIFIFGEWGVDVTALVAGVGVAGLAIGFAVKDSLANIFGGISLITDKAFQVGQRVALADGTVGIISDIGIRSTKLKTFDNELVIIPNGKLANETIKNFHRPDDKMRGVIPFGVEYGSKPEKVKKIILAELKKIKKIMKDPEPSVVFTEMADSSLNFKAIFWVKDIGDLYSTKEEVNDKMYSALNKNKIGIPFPTQTLYVKKGK